jgi:N-glycosidase YbiA
VHVTITFYRSDDLPYGCFSNFSAYGFESDGVWWPTCEHFYQAQKFVASEYADLIRRAETPRRAADLGRAPFPPLRQDWEHVKADVMRRAVGAKFDTHAEIREVLLSTGDQDIVENSPTDDYWGCGSSGTGRNMLGRILVETRARLRAHAAPSGDAVDPPARSQELAPDRRRGRPSRDHME